jgi:hypothetical protein
MLICNMPKLMQRAVVIRRVRHLNMLQYETVPEIAKGRLDLVVRPEHEKA